MRMESLHSLRGHLHRQLELFSQAVEVQEAILRQLVNPNQLPVELLDLLQRKKTMVESIQANNEESRPLVQEWMAHKQDAVNRPEYPEIEHTLQQIETSAHRLRSLDEEMLRRMGNPQADSDPKTRARHVLDAFRALN